jgi:hypothetical protein
MDVGGWLRGLGLGRYEEKFRENKIDFDVPPPALRSALMASTFPASIEGRPRTFP